ncbi:MAG: hypothetical protein IV100_10760, partial [Myxococcales bacterium]|nr:hypothetical protein [Myxococcales bacterium]
EAEATLKTRDEARDKKNESSAQRKRPTFIVRDSQMGPSIASYKGGKFLHNAINLVDGFFVSPGAPGKKGVTVEELLINIGYLAPPGEAVSVISKPTSEKVAAVGQVVADKLKAAGKGAHNISSILNGTGDLIEAIAVASPILRAVVGVIVKVAKMHALVLVNKQQAGVLVALVKSFGVPLDEIDALLLTQPADDPFAVHLKSRLTDLEAAIGRAEAVLSEWCSREGKSVLKKFKQLMTAGDMNKAFLASKDELHQAHQTLCNDLTIKVAVTVLGDSDLALRDSKKAVDDAVARAGEACHNDLQNLESDLKALFAAMGESLTDQLKQLGWSLAGLHTSVAELSDKQDEMISLQLQTHESMQQIMHHLITPSKVVIQHEPAAAFWRDVIHPATATELTWSTFQSAVFCELLEPANVPVEDWHRIKGHVKELFDVDGDDSISIYEYNRVTLSRQQTMLEICLQLIETTQPVPQAASSSSNDDDDDDDDDDDKNNVNNEGDYGHDECEAK